MEKVTSWASFRPSLSVSASFGSVPLVISVLSLIPSLSLSVTCTLPLNDTIFVWCAGSFDVIINVAFLLPDESGVNVTPILQFWSFVIELQLCTVSNWLSLVKILTIFKTASEVFWIITYCTDDRVPTAEAKKLRDVWDTSLPYVNEAVDILFLYHAIVSSNSEPKSTSMSPSLSISAA